MAQKESQKVKTWLSETKEEIKRLEFGMDKLKPAEYAQFLRDYVALWHKVQEHYSEEVQKSFDTLSGNVGYFFAHKSRAGETVELLGGMKTSMLKGEEMLGYAHLLTVINDGFSYRKAEDEEFGKKNAPTDKQHSALLKLMQKHANALAKSVNTYGAQADALVKDYWRILKADELKIGGPEGQSVTLKEGDEGFEKVKKSLLADVLSQIPYNLIAWNQGWNALNLINNSLPESMRKPAYAEALGRDTKTSSLFDDDDLSEVLGKGLTFFNMSKIIVGCTKSHVGKEVIAAAYLNMMFDHKTAMLLSSKEIKDLEDRMFKTIVGWQHTDLLGSSTLMPKGVPLEDAMQYVNSGVIVGIQARMHTGHSFGMVAGWPPWGKSWASRAHEQKMDWKATEATIKTYTPVVAVMSVLFPGAVYVADQFEYSKPEDYAKAFAFTLPVAMVESFILVYGTKGLAGGAKAAYGGLKTLSISVAREGAWVTLKTTASAAKGQIAKVSVWGATKMAGKAAITGMIYIPEMISFYQVMADPTASTGDKALAFLNLMRTIAVTEGVFKSAGEFTPKLFEKLAKSKKFVQMLRESALTNRLFKGLPKGYKAEVLAEEGAMEAVANASKEISKLDKSVGAKAYYQKAAKILNKCLGGKPLQLPKITAEQAAKILSPPKLEKAAEALVPIAAFSLTHEIYLKNVKINQKELPPEYVEQLREEEEFAFEIASELVLMMYNSGAETQVKSVGDIPEKKRGELFEIAWAYVGNPDSVDKAVVDLVLSGEEETVGNLASHFYVQYLMDSNPSFELLAYAFAESMVE